MNKSITIIPVLWSRKDKNGLYPIKIRTTKDRKSTYTHSGFSIKKSDWSDFKKSVKSSNENHEEINEVILKIIEGLEDNQQSVQVVKKDKNDFISFLKSRIEAKKDGNKFFSTKRYQSLYFHLLKFTSNSPISFNDINKDFIVRFTTYLEKNIKSRNDRQEASVNTIVNYLKVFKTILNHALRNDIIKINPIQSHLIPAKKKIKKVPLNSNEIWKLNELRPTNPQITKGMYDALNVFMFSFWSRGLRISDVLNLKYKHFNGEYFKILMEKTEEVVNIPLTINNIERIIPYIAGVEETFDWINRKYIRYSSHTDVDEQFAYSNSNDELFQLHSVYLGSLQGFYDLLKDRVDFYNEKVKKANRKRIYFHEEFSFDSKEMMLFFKNSDEIDEKIAYDNYMRDREIYLEFCKTYFKRFCKNKKYNNEYIFPFLRGYQHLTGFKMGEKISSCTSLINKNLGKFHDRFDTPKFTTHFARHSFTSTSKMMGVDIYDLKNWLGHTSVKNTEVYINTLEDPKDDMHSLKLYETINS
jgi:site-specific recombinase XerD